MTRTFHDYSADTRLGRLRRRLDWFVGPRMSPRKVLNGLLAVSEFAAGRETLRALPTALKIDISPLCNLACVSCIHESANASPEHEKLRRQHFGSTDRMSTASFRQIVEEVRGHTSAISMHYYGDPLMHRDFELLCGIAADAGIATHASTNFSFRLTDDRINSIANCGLSHLTVCVDGFSQATYERTRVGGRLDWVLDNLRRLSECRRRVPHAPRVEVQFIKYRHNQHELPAAARFFAELGVDQFTTFWGSLHACVDTAVDSYQSFDPQPPALLPRCAWPWVYMVIKFNGDAIPCCHHRTTEQYQAGGSDARTLGNVLRTSVREVWNEEPYRRARRLVTRPESNPDGVFCDRCSRIFKTDKPNHVRNARDWDIERARPDLVQLTPPRARPTRQ